MLANWAAPYRSASRAGRASVLRPRWAPKRSTNRSTPGVERTSSNTSNDSGCSARMDAASTRGLMRLPNGARSNRASTCIAPMAPVTAAAKVAS